jgi:Sec-independent protein translocase protein TatA
VAIDLVDGLVILVYLVGIVGPERLPKLAADHTHGDSRFRQFI